MKIYDIMIKQNIKIESTLYLNAPNKLALKISFIALVIPHAGQEIPSMLLNIHGISIFNTNNITNNTQSGINIAIFIILFLLFLKIISISIFCYFTSKYKNSFYKSPYS